jgi:hypothetical protein
MLLQKMTGKAEKRKLFISKNLFTFNGRMGGGTLKKVF